MLCPSACIRAAAAVLAVSFGPALAADTSYTTELDPVAHTAAERLAVLGIGRVTAELAGNQLTVRGAFSGLPSPATAAHLHMGAAMGVPGPVIGDLSATKSTAGDISGSVTLNSAQIAALDRNAIYVQLDSQLAPDGNLWGWLESSGADR